MASHDEDSGDCRVLRDGGHANREASSPSLRSDLAPLAVSSVLTLTSSTLRTVNLNRHPVASVQPSAGASREPTARRLWTTAYPELLAPQRDCPALGCYDEVAVPRAN